MVAAHDNLHAPRQLDDDEKRAVLTAGRRAGSLAAFAELIGMNPKTVWRAVYAWNRHRHQTLDTLLYATPLFNRAYDLGYAEARAGIRHHVALSIVGADRSPDNGYFQAKVVQEELIKSSSIPYTIIRSTQLMEFLGSIADAGQRDGIVKIATGQFQPIAADDVAAFVADAARGPPRNGMLEIAGPEKAPFDDIIRRYLAMLGDHRPVQADPDAHYFGGKVEEMSLVPTGEAQLGRIKLADWVKRKRVS